MRSAKQTGMAMVIVIWVLSLMTIMAGSFALTMRRETSVISAVKDNAVGLAVAEAGVAIARQMMLQKDESRRWRADGSVYQLHYQEAEIRVRLFSEQGKIDLNKADETLLTAMMSSTSVDPDEQQALVSAILDWRDQDDLVHINGAEKQQYEETGLTYHPANKEFQLIDELQMVLGMDSNIFQELRPLITVYSGQAQVNLKLASKEVLQVITNLDSEMLDDFMQQRIEANRAQLPVPALPIIENTSGNQDTNTNEVYTIISQARVFGDVNSGITVTLKKNTNGSQTNPFQVLDWQQIYPKVSLFSDEMEQQVIVLYDESEHKY